MFFLKKKLFALFVFFSQFLSANELYLELSNEDMGILSGIPRILKQDKKKYDGNYTQGIYFSYSFSPRKNQKVSFSLAQDLFTPSGEDKFKSYAEEGSRPFGSYSLIGGDFYWKQKNFLHNIGLSLGFLGRASGGAEMQNFFHKTFKKREGYLGWQDEVDAEFLASFEYSVAFRKNFFCSYVCIESSPSVSFSFGNLVRRVALGGSLRVGRGLMQDYMSTAHKFLSRGPYLQDGKSFFWNLFVGFYLVDVYYNALFDKKTSLTGQIVVKKKPQVTEVSFGGDVGFSRLFVRIAFVLRSKEYETDKGSEFLRLGLGYRL